MDWSSTDGSTRIVLPAEIVDAISGYVVEGLKSVPRRGAEVGGLLTGSVRLGPVTEMVVNGFEPIACEHRFGPSFQLSAADDAGLRAMLAGRDPSEILGFYRSHTRQDFGPETSDRHMVEQFFPGRSGVVLLIKAAGAVRLTGQYFFFQNGRLDMQSGGRIFLFEGTTPGGIAPHDQERSPIAPAPEVVEDDYAPERPAYRSEPDPEPEMEEEDYTPPTNYVPRRPYTWRKRLQWEVLAAGVLVAAALGLLYWQYHGAEIDSDTVTTQQRQPVRVSSVGLSVHPGEGGWRITWDTNAAAVRTAFRGALQVTENESQERIPLSAAEIHGGVVTYRPTSDDVTFRIELTAPDGSESAESYRVVRQAPENARTAPRPGRTTVPRAAVPPPVKVPPMEPETLPEEATAKAKPQNYVGPEVLHRVSPEVGEGIRPRIASPMPIDVMVRINREGRVTSAVAVQHGGGLVDYLAARAVAAARLWTFTPARQGGKPVESKRTIHFVFEQ